MSLYSQKYDFAIWYDNYGNDKKIDSFLAKHYHNVVWDFEEEKNIEQVKTNRIAFYLQSDTLVKSAENILKRLDSDEYIIFVPQSKKERSDEMLDKLGFSYEIYSDKKLKAFNPDLIVNFNDWSMHSRAITIIGRFLQIPTLCIQESMIDFYTQERMQFADAVALQGFVYLSKLKHQSFFLTGNPRYEGLKKVEALQKESVFINCNFTYNVFEEFREIWLTDIVGCLEDLGLSYIISQHPRDNGDLSNFKNVMPSGAGKVHNQLKKSSLVISRFSSLIHEAVLMGIPAIFYNPHNSDLVSNLEIDNNVVRLAYNKSDLLDAIVANQSFRPSSNDYESYLQRNCIDRKGEKLPSEKLACILRYTKINAKKNDLGSYVSLVKYALTKYKKKLFRQPY